MILNSQGDLRTQTELSFNKKQFVFQCSARNKTTLIQGRTLMPHDNFALYPLVCIKLRELEGRNLCDLWANSWSVLWVRFHINYNHQQLIFVWSYQQLINFMFYSELVMGPHDDTVNYTVSLCRRHCYCCRNKHPFSCWANKKNPFLGFCLVSFWFIPTWNVIDADLTQRTLFIIANVWRHPLHYNSSVEQ